MIITAFSAAFVGFVHSLAPGHWLPVVLMAKTKNWPLRTALLGALMTAMGHILISVLLGILAATLEMHYLSSYEHVIERYAAVGLIAFGILYATFSLFRHSGCSGHTHHGPSPEGRKAPFVFLFSVGFSPCVIVLPIFATAAAQGSGSLVLALISFVSGVLFALLGATFLSSLKLFKLDHPVFEHYGDVITGCGVSLMGVVLYFV